MGLFSTEPDTKGQYYIGSYDQASVPGSAFTNVAQVAASPCQHSVYELVNVYGNPGTTFSGNEIQQFDTHGPSVPCASVIAASVSATVHGYTVIPVPGATGPCVPCAAIRASGAPFPAAAGRAAPDATVSKRIHRGVTLKVKSSAAADLTFQFKKLRPGRKPAAIGGFLYPATAGQNSIRFTGVLRKGRPLRPGKYRVTVTGGKGAVHFRLRVKS
jgi:hypothetical protein